MNEPDHSAIVIETIDVLVIDDDVMQRLMISEIIEGSGLKCVAVARLSQAAAYLRRPTTIQVVVIDYWLLKRTGVDLYKRLQQSVGLSPEKVIFISADSSEKVLNDCMSVGAEFLAKSELSKLASLVTTKYAA